MDQQIECAQVVVHIIAKSCEMNRTGQSQLCRQCTYLGFSVTGAEEHHFDTGMLCKQTRQYVEKKPVTFSFDQLRHNGNCVAVHTDAELCVQYCAVNIAFHSISIDRASDYRKPFATNTTFAEYGGNVLGNSHNLFERCIANRCSGWRLGTVNTARDYSWCA